MLPSKKIFVLLALLIIGIGLLILYGYNRESRTDYDNTSNQGPLVLVTSSSTGITAPPTKNDYIIQATTTENLTATDVFTRDFLSQIIKLSQSGVNVTKNNANQVADNILKTAPIPSINAQQYTASDLTIVDSSPTNLLNYQNAIIDVFTKNWPAGENNEMLILKQTFSDNNPNAIKKLSNTIAIYEKDLSESLSLKVPKLVITKHLNVINSLSTYIQTLKMIQLLDSDPISGIAGLKAFTANHINLTTSMANLRIFLINTIK